RHGSSPCDSSWKRPFASRTWPPSMAAKAVAWVLSAQWEKTFTTQTWVSCVIGGRAKKLPPKIAKQASGRVVARRADHRAGRMAARAAGIEARDRSGVGQPIGKA